MLQFSQFIIFPDTKTLPSYNESFTIIKISTIIILIFLVIANLCIGKYSLNDMESLSDQHFFQWHFLPVLLLLALLFTNVGLLHTLSIGCAMYCFAFIDPAACNGFFPGLLGFVVGRSFAIDFFIYPFVFGFIFAFIFIYIGGLITYILGLEN